MLVVAADEIVGRSHPLDGVAKLIDVVLPAAEGRHHHSEDTAFPIVVKHRLVRLRPDRPEAVHSAKIVNAVHGDALLCCDQGGGPAIAVPIIASRVTQAASRSSLQPSVPAGRIGSTK